MNPQIVKNLKQLVKNKFPTLVSYCNKSKIETIKKEIQFDSCFDVDNRRSSGDIVFLWKQGVNLQIQNFTKWHKDKLKGYQQLYTGFYGHIDTSKRSLSQSHLNELKPLPNCPQFYFGDFNEITSQRKKYSAGIQPLKQMKKFQDALLSCELHEIHGYDPRFTQSNKRLGKAFTKEKLDQVLANNRGMELLHGSKYHTLPTIKSYHSPLLIYLKGHSPTVSKKSHIFRYEATQEMFLECSSIVKDSWSVNPDANNDKMDIHLKLKVCKLALTKWRRFERWKAKAAQSEKI